MPGDDESARDAALAEFADLVVHISRKLNAHAHQDPGVIALSSLEALVLRHVDREAGISSTQVAADLDLRTSNASTILRSLVDKGLLRREHDPDDRRAARFHLTDTARDSVTRLRTGWSQLLRDALPADLDPRPALAVLDALDNALR